MPITQVQGSGHPYDASMTAKLGAWRALGRRLDPQDPRVAREAAGLLISQLFFAPLLAEMRRLPFGQEFGHGGRMEDAFGEQLDLRIADTVARGDRSLTARLTEKLMRRQWEGEAPREGEAPAEPAPLDAPSQPVAWPVEMQARAAGAGGDK